MQQLKRRQFLSSAAAWGAVVAVGHSHVGVGPHVLWELSLMQHGASLAFDCAPSALSLGVLLRAVRAGVAQGHTSVCEVLFEFMINVFSATIAV